MLEQDALTDAEPSTTDAPEASGQEITQSKEYQELYGQYVRLAADFENFRKRQAQERESLFKYGAQTTVEAILPILDNLERAKTSLNSQSDPAMLYKSFEMLATQLLEALKAVGLDKMTPVGETFNPELHEALSQKETGDAPDQSILEVYQAGYRLHDRIIRAARVVVATSPQPATGSSGGFDPSQLSQQANPFNVEQGG